MHNKMGVAFANIGDMIMVTKKVLLLPQRKKNIKCLHAASADVTIT